MEYSPFIRELDDCHLGQHLCSYIMNRKLWSSSLTIDHFPHDVMYMQKLDCYSADYTLGPGGSPPLGGISTNSSSTVTVPSWRCGLLIMTCTTIYHQNNSYWLERIIFRWHYRGEHALQMYYVLWRRPDQHRNSCMLLHLGIATQERPALFVEQRECCVCWSAFPHEMQYIRSACYPPDDGLTRIW